MSSPIWVARHLQLLHCIGGHFSDCGVRPGTYQVFGDQVAHAPIRDLSPFSWCSKTPTLGMKGLQGRHSIPHVQKLGHSCILTCHRQQQPHWSCLTAILCNFFAVDCELVLDKHHTSLADKSSLMQSGQDCSNMQTEPMHGTRQKQDFMSGLLSRPTKLQANPSCHILTGAHRERPARDSQHHCIGV